MRSYFIGAWELMAECRGRGLYQIPRIGLGAIGTVGPDRGGEIALVQKPGPQLSPVRSLVLPMRPTSV